METILKKSDCRKQENKIAVSLLKSIELVDVISFKYSSSSVQPQLYLAVINN